jgi:hypothetical protein
MSVAREIVTAVDHNGEISSDGDVVMLAQTLVST